MTYDYIVVGAGSAGCVLAARLSEDPDVKVALVEAGGNDDVENIHIPAVFGDLFRTKVDWDYDSHEEEQLNRRRIFHPRGKVLGGTSSINAMLYLRNNRIDYDGWNQPGWSYDELLPLFKRSENNERGASAYHGSGGPLSVSDGRSLNPSTTALVEAALQAGYPANDDFNGPTQDGFGRFQVTQRNGRRHSTAQAFLHPALGRPNLTLIKHYQVHRVLIENGRAIGVTGQRVDEEITLHAEREVILSAGAYNSPQLLMLSGVGPADSLRAVGMDVVLDHPEVGQHLQDHPLVPLIFEHSQPNSLLSAFEPEHIRAFEEEGRGPLTSNGPEAGGYVRTRPGLPGPDVVYFAGPMEFSDSGLTVPTRHAITFGPVLLTQQSRGQITLLAADPTAKPKIEHRYFTAEGDIDVAVAGVRIALDIAKQPAFASFNEKLLNAPATESDDDLREYVRRYTNSIFHGSGACGIGRVVDAELKVYGVEGLRVADVSVMPTVGRGAPNASAIVIGEKAADLVRGVRSTTLAKAS
jgi:choline dehydrogenase